MMQYLQENALMQQKQQLQQVNNGSPEDKELMKLILAVWDAKLDLLSIEQQEFSRKQSIKRQKLLLNRAIEKLIKYARALFKNLFLNNRKWKNYAQEAEIVHSRDIQFDVLIYLSLHIEEFSPKGSSIKSSLKTWIEFNALNKGIDKFRSQQRKDLKPLSLDINFKGRDKEEIIPWEIGDKREEGLDEIVTGLDGRFLKAFLAYLQTDPDVRMVACAMKGTRCNCFVLVQLLYFREPKLNQTQAAKELGFNDIHQGLRAHWKHKCLPLLKKIAIEIAKNQRYEFD